MSLGEGGGGTGRGRGYDRETDRQTERQLCAVAVMCAGEREGIKLPPVCWYHTPASMGKVDGWTVVCFPPSVWPAY